MTKLFFTLTLLQALLFASFEGRIIDKITKQSIAKATISDSYQCELSDEDGFVSFKSDDDTNHIKAYGYRPYSIASTSKEKIIELEPLHLKALYLTFWGANIHLKTNKKILEIIQETDINAIVVDVKNEYGSTSYTTSVKKANSYGAYKRRTIGDMKNFMRIMKENNIYTIARIAVFKDELQAVNNKDYGIKNRDSTLWRNHDNMAWVDPFDERSHAYTIAIAEDAAKVGFDEINFDYIRFPARSGLKLLKPNTQKNRVQAIENFLKSAKVTLMRYGVFISVDIYGNICWARDDSGIGQTIESLAKHSDYLSPMLYPSGYADGTFGIKYPAEKPYKVIHKSLKYLRKKIELKRVRPWLQYFRDYTTPKKRYEEFEIKQQIKASDDLNTSGWLLWSPSSRYHKSYFNPSNL